ncbi:MAG: helix-turn-helix transcriptional regulator [Blastocatellia bacterium]|nr:helix-turn-helix transcriptional regulator [Blastocatellia bacterium]
MAKSRKTKKYTISVVAEQYDIHPQTLRLYEREGLIKPSRSAKGTRYYTEEDIEQLEVILNLTRDLGVNLAGVEIILNMREKMNRMQKEFENFIQYIRDNIEDEIFSNDERAKNALVPRRRIDLIMKSGKRVD